MLGLAGALAAPAAPATPTDAAAERGRLLMQQYQCGRCHVVPGVAAARGTLAASLDQYGRRSYISGAVANTLPLLQRWIVSPAALVPGSTMPDLGVPPAAAADMAAYLHTLR